MKLPNKITFIFNFFLRTEHLFPDGSSGNVKLHTRYFMCNLTFQSGPSPESSWHILGGQKKIPTLGRDF